MCQLPDFIERLELLIGRRIDPGLATNINSQELFQKGLGFSQFNEILLLFQLHRVDESFFQFLVDGTTDYSNGSFISSFSHFVESVDNFLRLALLFFGNIPLAFDLLSNNPAELEEILLKTEMIPVSNYRQRHKEIVKIINIPPEETYYLGHIIADNLRTRLNADPNNKLLIKERKKRLKIVEKGYENYKAYLTSDHLDVYVATSMRENHDFLIVNAITKELFNKPILKDLKVRYFDPTQAFCSEREDKGLSEALMLKRAHCTLYLIQDQDTLGKDSELATTLAQGKPVIAYIPIPDEEYLSKLINSIKKINNDKSEKEILFLILKSLDPRLAWSKEKAIRRWFSTKTKYSVNELKKFVLAQLEERYEQRSKTLKDNHPLGIQVNLETGVANGVLVVRDLDNCAKLIRNILLKSLSFCIEPVYKKANLDIVLDVEKEEQMPTKNSKDNYHELFYLYLREKVSNSIYRVISGDKLLTNTFWNYYLN